MKADTGRRTEAARNSAAQKPVWAFAFVLAAFLLAGPGAARPALAEDAPFLSGDTLVAIISGATLIGGHWAEYYAPDGEIIGKVRYLGLVHAFRGKWRIRDDHVCFEYERREYNTCSRFRLLGDRMRHYDSDGKPKRDFESRRLNGNRLEEFR